MEINTADVVPILLIPPDFLIVDHELEYTAKEKKLAETFAALLENVH